ncbi:MAG: sterol desaturase family protein [Acidobacteriota bacterium]|nr:sterol desaturase family protein [Acidobacteriota bacterium]
MTWNIISPAVIVAAVFVLILLEMRYPYDRGQQFFREGFWTDLIWYTFVQNYVLAVVIGQLIVWIDHGTGFSRLRLVSDWPLPLQVVFFLVTHDLYIYWFHRWQHSNKFLWRLHEAHHSARSVDWLAGTRSHVFEILINQTVEFAPMVLLGAPPEVPLIKGMISAVWGMYIHSNIDVHTGKLQLLINGPEAHRWHHAVDLEPPGMNFSTKLAIWDWLFNTMWLPAGKKPTRYGLTYVEFPKGYLRQNLFAFRPFRRTAYPPPVDPPPVVESRAAAEAG